MAEKDFRVKSGLIVGSLTTAGYVKTSATGVISSSASIPATDVSISTLTISTGLTGTSYNGTAGVTIAIDTSVVATASNTLTFTNKTYDTAGTGNVFRINGTQVSAITGSGSTAVLQTSPSITTSLTTGSASFDLVNTTATTVNFAGAATTLAIGAATGTATVNNATVTLANATALNINGASPSIVTSSAGTVSVFNTNATTANAFGAATTIAIGASTGTATINNATVTLANASTLNINGANPTVATSATGTLTLFNTNVTTVNAFGAATTATEYAAATSLTIGGTSAGQTVTIGGASTGASTYNFGTGATANATTKAVNIGTGGVTGSTTNIVIGSSNGGTTTINSGTVLGAATTQNVFNTVATTVNAFGAATTLNLGAGTGTTTVNNNLTVQGNLTVNGTTTTVNSTVTTYDDPVLQIGGDTAPTVDDNTDRGIEFRWHNGTSAQLGFLGFRDSNSRFVFIPSATNTSGVYTGTLGSFEATQFVGDLNGKLVNARTISATGDASWSVTFDGSANATAALTLATVNSNTGSFGDSITVPAITVNGKGLITAVTNTTIRTGTTAQTGVLQLTDSTSSTSTTTAATPNSVKTAYDLANAALPKAGGTMTGAITLRAGAAGAGNAPVYFTSGTNLTTAAAGAMEFDGSLLYFTPSTTRQTIAFRDNTSLNAMLPSQSGQSGKYLTTDGTNVSWSSASGAVTTYTLSANTETAADTTAKAGVNAIEYTIFMQQGTGASMKTRASKLLVLHNSGITAGATTSIDCNEYSIMENNGAMAGVNVTAKLNTSTSNVELLVTVTDAATTNVTVKFTKSII